MLPLVVVLGCLLLAGPARAAPGSGSVTPPTISGTAQVGQTLTEGHGTWTFVPSLFAYQWQDCDTAGKTCSPVKGANGQTYVVATSDVGHTLRVQETAFGWRGFGQATSAATAVVSAPPPPVPANSSTTTIMVLSSSAVTDQSVTLIATVTSSSAAKQPSGTLTFANGGTPISGCQGEPILPTGQSVTVTCQTSFAASVQQLTATFTPAPGSVVAGSVSAPNAFPVQAAPTSTTVAVSSRTVRLRRETTYTAIVQPSYLGAVQPSQGVDFFDNGQPVSACAGRPLTWSGAAAVATCSLSYARVGQHLISARYAGDANFASSISSPAQLVDGVVGRIHPILSWSFYYAPRFSKVLVLTLEHLPSGARVHVTCAGRRCPLVSRSVSVHRAATTAINLMPLFGGRRLRPGTVVTVSVQRPGWIGKRYSFKVRPGRAPRHWITCQAPGLAPGVGC